MSTHALIEQLGTRYPKLWKHMDEIISAESIFSTFKQLSDNYSPTLTVSRVQGPLVESFFAEQDNVKVDRNLRQSGTISLTIGSEPAPIWLSGHADICSYLTGGYDGKQYPLTPFCSTGASAGKRPAVALSLPDGSGPLDILAEGDMVTHGDGSTTFETDVADLPAWTRVVYAISAEWDRSTDEMVGYIDNQATCAAHILAAQVLSHYDVNVLFLINDEEEGPVDKGNQGFSRAMSRLLNRTPLEQLPNFVIVSDGHGQEERIAQTGESLFGKGAVFSGMSSRARGSVMPPQLLAFTRELATALRPHSVKLVENDGYVGRSDDISAMQFTQNIVLIGFPGTSSHFNKTPTMHCNDLVNVAKMLVVYALIAQDETWRDRYL